MAESIWFWQRIVSPLMAGLISELAARGRDVTCVAEESMSAERVALGWQVPDLGSARLRLAPDAAAVASLVDDAPPGTVHICQGLRGNGLVDVARRELTRRHARQWVVMERVEEHGWVQSRLKRLAYRGLIADSRRRLEGILAIGETTGAWLVSRGMPPARVVPFAYFLDDRVRDAVPDVQTKGPFRFLFVGQFIERKRLDLLITAMTRLADRRCALVVIGAGPLEERLRNEAVIRLGERVQWVGRQAQTDVPAHMAEADCLVLPSRHDGWGAVVSEALMAGTPAICSDRCGAAGVVRESGAGGVFSSEDAASLAALMRNMVDGGRQTPAQRAALAAWARCLGGSAGADYLLGVLASSPARERPRPPWAVPPAVAG